MYKHEDTNIVSQEYAQAHKPLCRLLSVVDGGTSSILRSSSYPVDWKCYQYP